MAKNKTLPVRSVCRNCGTPTVGRYCHICGQDLFAGTGRKLREIVDNSMDVVFAWDNKVWRTLLYLVAFPGRLTREYYAGRIARYVYPSKLFWFLTIIFFALLTSNVKFDDNGTDSEALIKNMSIPGVEIKIDDAPGEGAEKDAGESAKKPWVWAIEDAEESFSWEQFKSYVKSYAPYTVLLFVPLFALLIYAFFRRKEHYYTDYLVFSLHFHSFVFLVMSAALVVYKIFPGMWTGSLGPSLETILTWTPIIYSGLSLRTVFRPRIVPMIFKILLIAILYAVVMLFVIVLFVALPVLYSALHDILFAK